MIVYHQAGHFLPAALCDDARLLFVEFKTEAKEKGADFGGDFPRVKRAGEGHVVAVPGVADVPLAAPFFHIPVKRLHDQIGNVRGCGRTLGKHAVIAAKTGKERLHLGRENGPGKCVLTHTDIGNASEKVMDVELENLLFSHMGKGIVPGGSAASVSAGTPGDRELYKNLPENLALDILQQRIRRIKCAESSVSFRNLLFCVVVFRVVGQPVEKGELFFGGETHGAGEVQ